MQNSKWEQWFLLWADKISYFNQQDNYPPLMHEHIILSYMFLSYFILSYLIITIVITIVIIIIIIMEVILQLPCHVSGAYRYNSGQIVILHQPLSLWFWKLWGIPFTKLITPSKTNMTRKKWPFLMGDTSSSSFMHVIFYCHLSFRGCT